MFDIRHVYDEVASVKVTVDMQVMVRSGIVAAAAARLYRIVLTRNDGHPYIGRGLTIFAAKGIAHQTRNVLRLAFSQKFVLS